MFGLCSDVHLPEFPALETLRSKPTWVNRAGRVDRSACLEIRASELRTLTELKLRKSVRGDNPEAIGEVVINGRLLAQLHSTRLPYHLSGDFRTQKSNAMKDPENTLGPHFNPNKGAAWTKCIGLFESPTFMSGWSQTVQIVRWRSHERLAMHFLICRACEQKFLKLFAVLCSAQELDESAIAEAWIEQMEARHAVLRRPMDLRTIMFREKLIKRYGLLFRKRRVVCRKCLKVRYGDVRRERRVDTTDKALVRAQEQQRRAEARERKRMENSSQALAELRGLLG